METDGALIEWSVRGRPDAFVEVVRRHEVAVYKFIARRAGPEAADDLLGEVWERAFGARGRFWPEQADALPWLYGIARNVLRAHWRSERIAADGDAAAGPGEAVDPWDEVIERLDSAAWSRELATAVRELPAACREVLLLVAWEELTPAEAADVLGIPQGTARSRLHRARSELRLVLARHLHADGAGAGGAVAGIRNGTRGEGEEDTCQQNRTTPAKTR
jgi:RNA polymerase sigma factor (sigma-70 family)